MAYCEKCGAYIPDGQMKCLACGYDPSVRNKYSSGAAYQQQAQQDEAHRKEEERRRQEEERQRRQEEYRRNAEAEFARRQKQQAERERQANSYVNSHPYSRSGQVNSSRIRAKTNNKILSALSYLGILWILPYLACPDDKFAKYHAKQGLALFIFEIVAGFVGNIISIGKLLNLFTLYCIYKGMMSALNGKTEELPIIGQFVNTDDK